MKPNQNDPKDKDLNKKQDITNQQQQPGTQKKGQQEQDPELESEMDEEETEEFPAGQQKQGNKTSQIKDNPYGKKDQQYGPESEGKNKDVEAQLKGEQLGEDEIEEDVDPTQQQQSSKQQQQQKQNDPNRGTGKDKNRL